MHFISASLYNLGTNSLLSTSPLSSRDPPWECLWPRSGHVVCGSYLVHPVSPHQHIGTKIWMHPHSRKLTFWGWLDDVPFTLSGYLADSISDPSFPHVWTSDLDSVTIALAPSYLIRWAVSTINSGNGINRHNVASFPGSVGLNHFSTRGGTSTCTAAFSTATMSLCHPGGTRSPSMPRTWWATQPPHIKELAMVHWEHFTAKICLNKW